MSKEKSRQVERTLNGSDFTQTNKSPKQSISQNAGKVNTLQALREENNLTADEIVHLIKEKYPRYDRFLQSKCEHSELYGVTLVPQAMRLLVERYAGLVPSKEEKRTLKNRIVCRLSDEDFKLFTEKYKADGFTTRQGVVSFLIKNYINN